MAAEVVDLRGERDIDKITAVEIQLVRGMGEKDAFKALAAEPCADTQVLSSADVAGALERDAAEAHRRPGIGVAERLEQIERADVVDIQQRRVADQKIRLDLRRGSVLVLCSEQALSASKRLKPP